MTSGWFGQGLGLIAGVAVTLATTQGVAHSAQAKHHPQLSRSAAAIHAGSNWAYRHYAARAGSSSWGQSALQCVPFARENSGIELSGNAGTWWESAEGLYQRGAKPEVGSILNFRAAGRMRLGHVAVVTNVISARHIEIDHANWGAPGLISRDIDVVDVSPDNDWTSVRVALGHTDEYGSVYPTFGFIYDRPDSGTMLANTGVAPGPMPNGASADLRPAHERIELAPAPTPVPEEVAEAPDDNSVPAPRSYRRHHVARGLKSSMRSVHGRGDRAGPAATYRVSTRGTASSNPHKAARRHF